MIGLKSSTGTSWGMVAKAGQKLEVKLSRPTSKDTIYCIVFLQEVQWVEKGTTDYMVFKVGIQDLCVHPRATHYTASWGL